MKRSNPTPRAWKVQRGSTRYPCKGKHVGKTVRRYGREYRVDGCATPKRGTTVGQYILARLPDGEPQHTVPKPAIGRALARSRKGEPNTAWRERVPRLRAPAPTKRVRQPELDGPAWRAPRVPEMKGPKWRASRYDRVTRYGLRNRPAGYATVPDGWVQDRDATEQFHYGVIRYPAPLTEKQMYRYELTPWYDTPQDAAATLWESIDKRHREIIAASLAGRPLPGYDHAEPWEFIRAEAGAIQRETHIWPLGQYSAQEIEPVMRELVVLFGPGTPDPGRSRASKTHVRQGAQLPTDPVVIREHIQQIDDVVSIKRERGENVPQEWLNKRAALAAGLSGGSEPSGVASMLVYGHPQATTLRAHKYGNLVPISVTRVDSIERRMDEAQAAFAELAAKISKAEHTANLKSASTADRKRAKAYLASMEHTEDVTIRNLIHNETQPELNRLYRLLAERSR